MVLPTWGTPQEIEAEIQRGYKGRNALGPLTITSDEKGAWSAAALGLEPSDTREFEAACRKARLTFPLGRKGAET